MKAFWQESIEGSVQCSERANGSNGSNVAESESAMTRRGGVLNLEPVGVDMREFADRGRSLLREKLAREYQRASVDERGKGLRKD